MNAGSSFASLFSNSYPNVYEPLRVIDNVAELFFSTPHVFLGVGVGRRLIR